MGRTWTSAKASPSCSCPSSRGTAPIPSWSAPSSTASSTSRISSRTRDRMPPPLPSSAACWAWTRSSSGPSLSTSARTRTSRWASAKSPRPQWRSTRGSCRSGPGRFSAWRGEWGESKRARMKTEEDDHPMYRRGQDTWSADLAGTILGEATRTAVDSLVIQLAAAAPKIPETVAPITALVADVSGSELVINVGTTGGVRVGSEYAVVRPRREIRDPGTGKLLRRATTPVGKIKITSADEGSATGMLTGDLAHVGDCVGACPVAPAGGPPPQNEAQGPAPALSTPSTTGVRAVPAVSTGPVSGPFTWTGYTFKGTEHFRYDAFTTFGGQSQSGFYVLDGSDAGGARTRLQVQGQMGKNPFSSTIILEPNAGLSATQMGQLGPAALALFSPSYAALFMGHPWVVGEGWSSGSAGQSSGFKVESTCQYAGVQGLRGVLRQNDQIIMDLCISPNVGLPLAVTMGSGSGATSYSYAVKLTQFRP